MIGVNLARASAIALTLCCSLTAGAQIAVPPLTGRITDQTATLTAEQKTALEQTLQAFESRKGSQLAVLIVSTTAPETIEQYALRVAEQWKLGRKKVDDGAILVVAKTDRTLRIEVGYGLEGALNDATSKRIISETITPRFKQEDFYGGITAGIEQMIRVVDGEPLPESKAVPARGGGNIQQYVPVIFMVALVMGGIYMGVFTATEGAAMGAVGAMIFALARKVLTWKSLYASLVESARTTSMLFMILIGALMFAEFVNITTMPADLTNFVSRFELHPITVVAAIMVIYVILGTAMEELSMILLTLPVFFPIIVHLGFDPVWFGVLIVVVVEIGLISPPVGMNLFVLSTLLPEVPTRTVFRGVMPFVFVDIIRLAILVAFPAISLYLPSLMK